MENERKETEKIRGSGKGNENWRGIKKLGKGNTTRAGEEMCQRLQCWLVMSSRDSFAF